MDKYNIPESNSLDSKEGVGNPENHIDEMDAVKQNFVELLQEAENIRHKTPDVGVNEKSRKMIQENLSQTLEIAYSNGIPKEFIIEQLREQSSKFMKESEDMRGRANHMGGISLAMEELKYCSREEIDQKMDDSLYASRQSQALLLLAVEFKYKAGELEKGK
ncbi:MAG: hypothetical protein RIT04_309 [Candidatus Parcubacteria bacterium]|jgi:hypothetical protein